MPKFRDRSYAAFLFDMDGTMLDSSVVVERLWREWAIRNGVAETEILAAVHGVRAIDVMTRFGRPGKDFGKEVDAFIQAELDDVDGIVPIDGILPFVKSLDPARWGVVTSAPRKLAIRRLQAVELPFPATLITAEDVTEGKPDPEGFLRAAEMLGVPIGECLIFEDSSAGVAAARASGAQVAIVGRAVAPTSADIVISDYR